MKIKILVLVSALLFSLAAEAAINGQNVVLVHGFRSQDISEKPNLNQQQQNAVNYWSEYWGSRAEANLYWSSSERVTGVIKDRMRVQIKALESSRTCSNGCVFVTHSTGDLVVRDSLSRLNQWGVDVNNFKVLAVLDFAGAGGGTEIANVAVSISEGSGGFNSIARSAINAFLGFTPTLGELGVLYDLQPTVARSIATGNNATPRLRFVGMGTEYAGLTKGFILGADDSTIPVHSACGSRTSGSFESCNSGIRANGQLRSSSAPSSLYFNHFPILMGERTDHSEVINNNIAGGDYATIVNNRNLGGLDVDFNDYTERKWWSWWHDVRLLRNGDSKSMSANVYDTLN